MSAPDGGLDLDALDDLYEKARAAEDAGDLAGAERLFRACLALDPADHCGVAMRLAALGLARPDRAPPAYVASLFDQHAEVFDAVLVDALGYRVPTLARRLAGRHVAPGVRMLDLGCGTGLAGVAFRDLAAEAVGVDIAPNMLALADERCVYDALYEAEAVAFLETWDEEPFDLILATDVWPYLGDLAPFAAAAARCLVPGGHLIASTERADEGWRVNAGHRFAHATDYVSRTLAAAGLETAAVQRIVVRKEEGEPVPGDLVLARDTRPVED